jgi:thiosulfate/3-mercaptopyruvate sulfurtransferase
MSGDPVIEPGQLLDLGRVRLPDVRKATAFEADRRADVTRVPIEVWEAAVKSGETSFENVADWEHAIASLGVDAPTMDVGAPT